MRSLPKPSDDASEVFALCIGKIRNPDLKQRLTHAKSFVAAAAGAYETAALSANLHTVLAEDTVAGNVTKDEMIGVYTARMVTKGQPGRPVYDKILSMPAHGRCPLCGIGQVSSLDHHLPKSKYPIHVVTPTNLVPSCDWCQRSKMEACPRTAEEQTLHPYYDDFESGVWLRADVIEGAPASFYFLVQALHGWNPITTARIQHHMKVFKLPSLYAANAGSQLANMRGRLAELFHIGGIENVRSYLMDEARSYERISLNSWQSAMYRGAAASQWFCEGGFANE